MYSIVSVILIVILAIQDSSAKLCPVPENFIGDICSAVPVTQTGIDVFLGVSNDGFPGSCHCRFQIDGEPMTGNIRTLYTSRRTTPYHGNYCPGLTTQFSSEGQHLLDVNGCTDQYQLRYVSVPDSQASFDMHIRKEAQPMMLGACLIVGFRDLNGNITADKKNITATCSKIPDNPSPSIPAMVKAAIAQASGPAYSHPSGERIPALVPLNRHPQTRPQHRRLSSDTAYKTQVDLYDYDHCGNGASKTSLVWIVPSLLLMVWKILMY